MANIEDRVASIHEKVARACQRSGGNPAEVALVAASKTRTADEILAAHEAGITDFGENYWQDARPKMEVLPGTIRWHFIGRLQANKTRNIARNFHMLQSLDSDELAQVLSKVLVDIDKKLQVLVEVNVDSERTKGGVEIDAVPALVERLAPLPGIDLCGLMTMGAPTDDEPTLRHRFRDMRVLFDSLPKECRRVLSMGMSSDFEIAIEEGATMVRLGTAIFGPRAFR
jgi:pyridoxal phosphate enzyme (YggS family)